MRNLRENQRCWLIAEPDGRVQTLAGQFAELRGLGLRVGPIADGSLSGDCDALVATSFADFKRMTPREREVLRAEVTGGATLYIRGGFDDGVRYQLAPIVDVSFTVGRAHQLQAYSFTHHAMIPAILRGEESPFGGMLNCAGDFSGPVEPILVARHDSLESPVVFAYRAGRGAVICDVQPDDESSDTPLIWRMADPVQRCINVSALIAVDWAAGRDLERQVAFNLTIDDIPLGYDYFNESMLKDFFAYVESRGADLHLDCAWIPTSRWISRRYVEILKSHGAGFVWHGMHRHIDHQKIDAPVAELDAGKRAMAMNARRYGIKLQPVIIFPYERAHPSTEELLLKEGFLAGAEQPRHDERNPGSPEYLSYCSAACVHESGLRFLHRYESDFLTRDRMLAIAALGMPILGFAHPKDVRLRRGSRIVERGGTFAHFDEVLEFASAKGLPGRSLEEIARELFDKKSESVQLECA